MRAMVAYTAEILLVEDNPHDAELTMLALRKEGLGDQVEIAKNGVEALNFLVGEEGKATSTRGLKLVLLDLKLPKLNGFEVLERVKSNKELFTIPIVILTSSAVESDIKKAYELGANSYIVKPIDFSEHRKAVIDTANYWLKINNTLN